MPRFVLLLVLVWLALFGAAERAEAKAYRAEKTASGVFANPPPDHAWESEPQANDARRVDAVTYGETASGRPFFANGDPVNRFDPDGRFGKDIWGNPYDRNLRLTMYDDEGNLLGYRRATQEEAAEWQARFQDGLQRGLDAYMAGLLDRVDQSLSYYDTNTGRLVLTAELAAMLLTDGAAARYMGPQMTQLQLNQMAGRVGEAQARILLERQGMEILGEHVTARVGGEIRYIDKLVSTPSGKQVVAVEVKAGNAIRGAD